MAKKLCWKKERPQEIGKLKETMEYFKEIMTKILQKPQEEIYHQKLNGKILGTNIKIGDLDV